MNTVKVGGRNYDSTQLMKAVNDAKLVKTSKGGLVVVLTFNRDTNQERMTKLTRNQLVKLVTAFEKKDTSRPLSKRIQDLTRLSKRLEDFSRMERVLMFVMSDKEKKALKVHQKWGNRFFNRDKALKNAKNELLEKETKVNTEALKFAKKQVIIQLQQYTKHFGKQRFVDEGNKRQFIQDLEELLKNHKLFRELNDAEIKSIALTAWSD